MSAWKYIVFVSADGLPTPVIFAPWLQHKAVAEALKVKPRSAGFLKLNDTRLVPTGESDSLGLRPHPEDAEILNP